LATSNGCGETPDIDWLTRDVQPSYQFHELA
jgi:hypothetical protein